MNILILYATYSSGTETAAHVVGQCLAELNHNVVIKNISIADIDELADYDVLILGSPSWWVDDKDGQPHEFYKTFFNLLPPESLKDTKCAVFGLGHSDYYRNFCGAVEILEQKIVSFGGTLLCDSLKVDKYYFDQKANDIKIKTWVSKCLAP